MELYQICGYKGIFRRKEAPLSIFLADNEPPSFLAISILIYNPIPVPLPTSFVVTSGSNILFIIFDGIPPAESVMFKLIKVVSLK